MNRSLQDAKLDGFTDNVKLIEGVLEVGAGDVDDAEEIRESVCWWGAGECGCL